MTATVPWIAPGQPFPPDVAEQRGPDDLPGLVLAGGDLQPARLLQAYRLGVFPWFSDGQPILWWSPDPRMVLKVADFRLRRSLRKRIAALLRHPGFALRVDTAFTRVMQACAAPRDGQPGSWITDDIVAAYSALHAQGHAHSFEVWIDGTLCAGLYGVNIGRMFYGESMFTTLSDGSKTALFALCCACRARGIEWIDCQQVTGHLASLGARPVARADFLQHLRHACAGAAPRDWAYDQTQLFHDLKAHVAA